MKRQTGFGWWVREGSNGEPEYLHWTGDRPEEGGPWVAVYNPKRVWWSKHAGQAVYSPYPGTTDWATSANMAMVVATVDLNMARCR